jgi:phage terminase large subunit-like protein
MTQDRSSQAALFQALPEREQLSRIALLTDAEAEAMLWDWPFWARPNQQTPAGDWTYWLILAGRGFGKTRTGAEWVRQQVKTSQYVNLIGATADDARDIMVQGESGILAICPDGERPEYRPSQRKLVWPNGAVSLIFTADEPERLRGKQHSGLWGDELAAWRYPEALDQAKLGLRLGAHPQACFTTTPRPTKLVKSLASDPATVVTRGTTYDNQANLAPTFFSSIIRTYEGTRLGRQELQAEILDDNPNALWNRKQIDALRVKEAPAMKRVVIGVDPSVTSNEDSDLAGIIAAGIGADDHGYVLDDLSLIASPDGWARAAVKAYHDLKADRLVAEVNNGGDLVELVIRTVDRNVSYKKVHASRGKMIRAEPIAALYEQGRVHHVGSLQELEDEMCDYDPITSSKSPDRMDALVWAFTELFDNSTTGLIDYFERASRQEKGNG